ncbi:MAG: carbohydrate kinase [Roseovarius sp.]|nr:carbohydrate kinase [Roseovarius sp.]
MILCCGESLIDMIPCSTDSGQSGFIPHPGGSVYNTAIALGRLGANVGLLTGLSTDLFGKQLSDFLVSSNVHISYAVTSGRPTTLAFVNFVDGHATYHFYDENSAGKMLALDDMPNLESNVSALFFGGISLACEPGAKAYSSFFEREKNDRPTMLDLNIRPGFITDKKTYRNRLEKMMSNADIVKVSEEDIGWLFPSYIAMDDKISMILDRGPSVVVLTHGANGATGYHKSGYDVHVPAYDVPAVDTIGAGDSFNAGVLSYLFRQEMLSVRAIGQIGLEMLKEAVIHGSKVAAFTVTRSGANPPWAREIQ